MNVLLIEDNRRLADTIVAGLRDEDLTAVAAPDGATGLALARRRDADVVVLDLGLPDIDGIEVLRVLRAERLHVPVLVLTARDAVDARVTALEAGADDYLLNLFLLPALDLRCRNRSVRTPRP